MAKRGPKPEYARIRIETLESHIGRCIAKGDNNAESALRFFARQCGIYPSESKIQEYADIYKAELAFWRRQDEERKARQS